MSMNHSAQPSPRSAKELLDIFYTGIKYMIADTCFNGIMDLAGIVNSYLLPSDSLRFHLLPPFPIAKQIIDIYHFSDTEIQTLIEEIYSKKTYKILFGDEKPSFAAIPKKLRAMVAKNNFQSGDILAYADLSEMKLESIRLSGNLQHVNLSGAVLHELSFRNADMRCIDFSNAKTLGLAFENTNMYRANLTRAKLVGASCSKVDLTEAIMVGTDCTHTNFAGGANMTGANTKNANFKGTIYEPYAEYIGCDQVDPLAIWVKLFEEGISSSPKIHLDHLNEVKSFVSAQENYRGKNVPAAMAAFLTPFKDRGYPFNHSGHTHDLCAAILCLSGNDDPRSFICEKAGLSTHIWVEDYGMTFSFQTLYSFKEQERKTALRHLPASVIFSDPNQLPPPSPGIQRVMRRSPQTDHEEYPSSFNLFD